MFLLHVTYPRTGYTNTIPFETPLARALVVISLASHPVVLRVEDPR